MQINITNIYYFQRSNKYEWHFNTTVEWLRYISRYFSDFVYTIKLLFTSERPCSARMIQPVKTSVDQ